MTIADWAAAALVAFAVAFALLGDRRLRLEVRRRVHELRRALQGVQLAIESPRSPEPAVAACLERARAELDRLARLGVGGTGSGRIDPVDAREALRLLERRWRHQERVRFDLGRVPAAGERVIDRACLDTVVDNLLANALEHASGDVTVRGSMSGDGLRVSVGDEGTATARRRPAPPPEGRGHGSGIALRAALAAGARIEPVASDRDRPKVAAVTLPARPAGSP